MVTEFSDLNNSTTVSTHTSQVDLTVVVVGRSAADNAGTLLICPVQITSRETSNETSYVYEMLKQAHLIKAYVHIIHFARIYDQKLAACFNLSVIRIMTRLLQIKNQVSYKHDFQIRSPSHISYVILFSIFNFIY